MVGYLLVARRVYYQYLASYWSHVGYIFSGWLSIGPTSRRAAVIAIGMAAASRFVATEKASRALLDNETAFGSLKHREVTVRLWLYS